MDGQEIERFGVEYKNYGNKSETYNQDNHV